MSTATHDLSQLDDPVAQQLLTSTAPARFAYTSSDGTSPGGAHQVSLER